MTRISWVRHGPTHEKAFTGWRDVPADLSDTAALQRLNEGLPQSAVLISSDLKRAINTADALQSGRLRKHHDPDLRELNFGDWDGLVWQEVADQYPDLSRFYWEDPGHHAPPNGESWFEAAARIDRATDQLLKHTTTSEVIVVAHFGTILTQLARAGGMTAIEAFRHKIDNLSVTETYWDGRTWSVGKINHVF